MCLYGTSTQWLVAMVRQRNGCKTAFSQAATTCTAPPEATLFKANSSPKHLSTLSTRNSTQTIRRDTHLHEYLPSLHI